MTKKNVYFSIFSDLLLRFIIIIAFICGFSCDAPAIPNTPEPQDGATKIKIGSNLYESKFAVDTVNGLFYFFQKDTMSIVDLNDFSHKKETRIHFSPISNIPLTKHVPVVLNSDLYLINDLGEEIYKWDETAFIRQDDSSGSYKLKYSSVFVKDGRIFRYGGYGFNRCTNVIACFNPGTRIWDAMPAGTSQNFPEGACNTEVYTQEEKTYFFGGFSVNPSSLQKISWDECWSFDWKDQSWHKCGTFKIKDIKTFYGFTRENRKMYISQHVSLICDFAKNNYKVFKNLPILNCLKTGLFYYKDYYYILGDSPVNTDISIIKTRNILGDFIEQDNLVRKNYNYKSFILTALALLGIGYSIYFFYKRIQSVRKIRLQGVKLVYLKKEMAIEPIHKEIIDFLLKSEEASTNELIMVINKEHLHISQAQRILQKTIEAINFKLRLLTGTDADFIQMKKSDIDQRIKVYSIDKTWFSC